MFFNATLKARSELIPVFTEGAAIPKVIYQVYATRNLPLIIEENVLTIRALNPHWEYRLFDDAEMIDFIRTTYGEAVLGYYCRINNKYGAARADFFRYLLMYKHGGVYLDVKSSLEIPLDEVLRTDDVYLLSRWPNSKGQRFEGWGTHRQLKSIGGQEFQQWHIIAAPGHPFLRAVIERMLDNIDDYNPLFHNTGKDGVLRLTGPITYTLSITPLLSQHRHRLVNSQDELGLKYSVFGSSTALAHKSIFKFHYTELTEPVVILAGTKKLLWKLFGPFQKQVVNRVNSLLRALARRFPDLLPYRG
jgi:hypothetical protein